MRFPTILRVLTVALLGFAVVHPAYATFHEMQIEQVIVGVNGDTSAQAIQLRMRAAGQNLVSFARLRAWDAAGLNPILVKDMTSNVANSSLADNVLIVSSNFFSYMPPGFAADFIMTQPIPASYLAAGRLTYEDDGGTILWSLSWGGASYTGSNLGDVTNDADGNFGPSYSSALPTSSRQGIRFTGTAAALSINNLADYALTANPATVRNNARTSFTVLASASTAQVVALTRESNNIRVTWTAVAGRTNTLQRSAGTINGSYSNNFTSIFIVTNAVGATTNYLDVGAATNFPARYYRVRFTP